MSVYRVLWNDSTDTADRGRWQDVDATDEAHATWQAAVSAGQGSVFLAVAELPSLPSD